LKKTLLYLVAAFIIGVLLIVVPLIVISQIGNTPQNGSKPSVLSGGLRQLDGESDTKTVSNKEVIILAIAFVIALITYGIIGPKAPRRYNMRLGVPPY
jgi:hypothetical protein